MPCREFDEQYRRMPALPLTRTRPPPLPPRPLPPQRLDGPIVAEPAKLQIRSLVSFYLSIVFKKPFFAEHTIFCWLNTTVHQTLCTAPPPPPRRVSLSLSLSLSLCLSLFCSRPHDTQAKASSLQSEAFSACRGGRRTAPNVRRGA